MPYGSRDRFRLALRLERGRQGYGRRWVIGDGVSKTYLSPQQVDVLLPLLFRRYVTLSVMIECLYDQKYWEGNKSCGNPRALINCRVTQLRRILELYGWIIVSSRNTGFRLAHESEGEIIGDYRRRSYSRLGGGKQRHSDNDAAAKVSKVYPRRVHDA
jgi:hypothetical protein